MKSIPLESPFAKGDEEKKDRSGKPDPNPLRHRLPHIPYAAAVFPLTSLSGHPHSLRRTSLLKKERKSGLFLILGEMIRTFFIVGGARPRNCYCLFTFSPASFTVFSISTIEISWWGCRVAKAPPDEPGLVPLTSFSSLCSWKLSVTESQSLASCYVLYKSFLSGTVLKLWGSFPSVAGQAVRASLPRWVLLIPSLPSVAGQAFFSRKIVLQNLLGVRFHEGA